MPRFYAGHPVIPARQVAVATGSSAYADDDARENGNHPGSVTVVPLTPTLIGANLSCLASSSCAGLTRASIFFARKFLRRSMDCRVKPGNDDLTNKSLF